MTGRGEGRKVDVAGGPAPHVPVLLAEVGEALDATRGGIFLDGTFGAGGYTRAILDAHPDNRVVAIDRDPDAIANGQALVAAYDGRLTLVHGRFDELDAIAATAGAARLDGVVLDIGVHLGKPRLDGEGVWDADYALEFMRQNVNMPD